MIPSEGDGVAGQHGKQGYMLLFVILARPLLMVAGLFSAMIIMMAIGKFVGAAFLVYYSSVSAGRVGIISWIVHSIMLCAVMVIFSHKIFGLITHLPDKVIRWIGQMHDDLGTGESENRIRGIAVAGAGLIQRAGGTAAGALAGG
jgi:conjugal transfer/type IV secretion protein DotA/TraY